MKKAIFGLVLGTGMFLSTVSGASAYRGDPNVKGPNYTPERHEAMTKAFENNDFEAWKNLMQDKGRKVLQLINESNFAKFAEMHKLRLGGNIEEANKIRLELGLGQRLGFNRGPNR